jgi:hypothetical protein
MRLNIRLMGILHGILLISLIGYYTMRIAGSVRTSSSDDRKNSGGVQAAMIVLGILLMIIGYLGVFFGRLIKASVSRQREFLADASSVQFTRNPDGIAGALKKIGGLAQGSTINDRHAEESSHMFFSLAVPSLWGIFATHPPLDVRIRALDPQFDGRYPNVQPLRDLGLEPTFDEHGAQAGGEAPSQELTAGLAGDADDRALVRPEQRLAEVGAPRPAHVEYARSLLDGIPPALQSAVRETFSARAVVYALLLSPDPSVRKAQWAGLTAGMDAATAKELQKIASLVDPLGDAYRLPLADLAVAALRYLSLDQYEAFKGDVDRLIHADQRVELFEYALRWMIVRHLEQHFHPTRPAKVLYKDLPAAAQEILLLLSVLAYGCSEDAVEASRAFSIGVSALGLPAQPLRPREQAGLAGFDQAVRRLAQGAPPVKKAVVDAAVRMTSIDEQVTVREAELIRALCDSIDCPMPPLLASP